MKRIGLGFFVAFLTLFFFLPMPVKGDIGPKPSVVIDFVGFEEENYYATLLSSTPSTGPYSVLSEEEYSQRYHEEDEDYHIWEKFVAYEDPDGYYFLQYFQNCKDTSQFVWGYYPPQEFKILLYFPDLDTFVVSAEPYERYAFDSYFRVDGKDLELLPNTIIEGIFAEKNYDYTWEIISLLARIIATIAIEVLIALLLGLRGKSLLLFIAGVNIFTQSILNILLNIINYNHGSMAFVFIYILLELLIIAIEGGLYGKYLGRFSEKPLKKGYIWVYAIGANLASLGMGIYIAKLVPGIF